MYQVRHHKHVQANEYPRLALLRYRPVSLFSGWSGTRRIQAVILCQQEVRDQWGDLGDEWSRPPFRARQIHVYQGFPTCP